MYPSIFVKVKMERAWSTFSGNFNKLTKKVGKSPMYEILYTKQVGFDIMDPGSILLEG